MVSVVSYILLSDIHHGKKIQSQLLFYCLFSVGCDQQTYMGETIHYYLAVLSMFIPPGILLDKVNGLCRVLPLISVKLISCNHSKKTQ